jgi:DNA adenine methylase
VYLDPPFYKKAEKLYNHFFDQAQHEYLRDYLADLDLPWFLSYDDCNEVRQLYRDMSSVSVNCLYNAARVSDTDKKRKSSSELVITNLDANYSEIKFPGGGSAELRLP